MARNQKNRFLPGRMVDSIRELNAICCRQFVNGPGFGGAEADTGEKDGLTRKTEGRAHFTVCF